MGISDVCYDFLHSQQDWRPRVELLRKEIAGYDPDYTADHRQTIIDLCDRLLAAERPDEIPFMRLRRLAQATWDAALYPDGPVVDEAIRWLRVVMSDCQADEGQ